MQQELRHIPRECYRDYIGYTVTVGVQAGGASLKCFTGILADVRASYIRILRMAGKIPSAKPYRPYSRCPGIRVNRSLRADTWRRVMITIAADKIISFTVRKPVQPADIRYQKPMPPLPLLIFILMLLLLFRRD